MGIVDVVLMTPDFPTGFVHIYSKRTCCKRTARFGRVTVVVLCVCDVRGRRVTVWDYIIVVRYLQQSFCVPSSVGT